MARLWKMFGKTPFMVNPHLGILGSMNPREKGSSMTAAQRRMSYVRSFRKNPKRRHHTKRHRTNPFPVGGLIVNPRKRHRKHKTNPSIFSRARRRASTALGGFFSLPPLQTVLWTGVGLIGTPYIENKIVPYLPSALTTNTLGKYAVRVGTVLGLGFLAKKTVGPGAANAVLVGGGTYVVTSAVREFFPDTRAYIPGVGAYLPNIGTRAGMGAYQPNTTGMAAASWGARNNISSAGDGGMNVVAGRFRRFQ